MSNMKEIAKKLQGTNATDKNRWVQVKTGWLNFIHCSKKENLLQKIEECVTVHPARLVQGIRKLKKNTTISRQSKKSEVLWERSITEFNSNVYNQLCVGKGNVEAIDLIYSENQKDKKCLIEFKTISNTPLYAFVEIIKNYCLLRKISQQDADKVEELMLLAPKCYFNQFKHEIPISEFYKTIEQFNSEQAIKFSIYYLDLDDKDLELNISIKKDKLEFKNWVKLDNTQMWLDLK